MKSSSLKNMKKKMVIFTFLLVAIISISGCGDKDDVTGAAVKDSVCNAPYFEYKQGDCCLDKNANSICDSDEDIVEEATTETATEEVTVEAPAVTEVEEVEITLDDACTDTTYFECKSSYITKDEVFFKFETKRDGYTHLRKLSVTGCEKEFSEKSKSSEGYGIRSSVIIGIPCSKNSLGTEVKDTDYVVDYVFYPASGLDSDTGEWSGKPRNIQRSSGKLSGTVRAEPKKV
tara:strand:- start:785 stop:1480 length:696 start_codon:yes stop_codon:yes gene_type:complete